jgi:hypothetical protein
MQLVMSLFVTSPTYKDSTKMQYVHWLNHSCVTINLLYFLPALLHTVQI